MPGVLVAVWIALGLAVAAVAGAATYVVARAIGAWRSLRALTRGARERLQELEAESTLTERRAGELSAKSGRLTDAAARLRTSLETLGLLRAAAQEAGAGVRRARSFMPRK